MKAPASTASDGPESRPAAMLGFPCPGAERTAL